MLSFESDYIEGAHSAILEALAKSNMEALSGYGSDSYTKSAKEKIALACGLQKEQSNQVYFLTGDLLAKGRLLGIQFDTLFTGDLYFKISRNAIDRAEELKSIFREKGYKFYLDSPTNQQFVILENSKMAELQKSVRFSFWEKYDENHTVVRFATSWATTREKIEELKKLL